MVPDPAQAVSPPASDEAAVRRKFRLRFRKAGDLRLLSHHDLMRCFQRMLRRAGLPFRTTEGFNPRPRMTFALSLPLGIVGGEEVVELELSRDLPPEEVRDRLAQQAPPGLEILSARRIEPGAAARVRRVSYRVPLPPGRAVELAERVAALLAAPEHWIERTRPHLRKINLRPFLDQIRVADDALAMDLWVRPEGMARPEEVLGALGLEDIVESGAVVERAWLELEDETSPQISDFRSEIESTFHPRSEMGN